MQAEKRQFEFEVAERAAIREFDGGQNREDAEKQAKAELAAQRKAPERTIYERRKRNG